MQADDQTFRTIILVGFMIVIPIGVYHRMRSWATGDKIDRGQEGMFILFTLRPLAAAGMVGMIAFLINPASMAWSSVPLPVWMRWVGVGFGLMAASLITWTFVSLGTNLTDTVVTKKDHTLVTTGPYRWVRHPFYTSVALAVLANSLAAANWFVFLTGGLVFTLLVLRTRKEEENLIARFGDEYRNYMGWTGRFVAAIRVRRLARCDIWAKGRGRPGSRWRKLIYNYTSMGQCERESESAQSDITH